MLLALSAMDPTLRGIFFLVAVILFVIAAVIARPMLWGCLVALGLAFAAFVFMWDAFSLA